MAGASKTNFRKGSPGEQRNLREQFNKLVDDVETLRAKHQSMATKLDEDAGVTATTFVSADGVLAAALTAGKVNP